MVGQELGPLEEVLDSEDEGSMPKREEHLESRVDDADQDNHSVCV
jgi:hypothetical protein